ncbi:zinc finger and BTB domain containing 8 opposite strand [Phyllostomus discolor]|uniref:Protein archease n=2 Tax=Phyllostomus discolor TaxID=89673 RepID=A0A834ECU1_9CHIR|nr:zinc finger and BTB domain containing 8 opposite strand [Phyllostomus discolor]
MVRTALSRTGPALTVRPCGGRGASPARPVLLGWVRHPHLPCRPWRADLDHTADVQLHAWGDTLEEAFEQCAMAMFGYMTDTGTVEPLQTVEVETQGDDLQSLLFHFLDEWLYKFSADEFFIPREVKVLSIDQRNFKLRSIGWGEEFSLSKHPQGTEVKAITYSAMQVYNEEKPQVFVIIDI